MESPAAGSNILRGGPSQSVLRGTTGGHRGLLRPHLPASVVPQNPQRGGLLLAGPAPPAAAAPVEDSGAADAGGRRSGLRLGLASSLRHVQSVKVRCPAAERRRGPVLAHRGAHRPVDEQRQQLRQSTALPLP